MAAVSKVLRTVGQIAGAVATVASFINPATAVLGVSIRTIGTVAAVASAVASVGAQLTAKRPPARGSVNNVLVAAEPPSPYLMGRTYFAGVLRHDTAWGGKVGKVYNPYRGMVLVYSVAGPVEALESTNIDYQAVTFSGDAATGYYAGFLYRDYQLGARPESTALASYASWGTMPGWGSSSKLSGKAAVLLNFKFDKDGKVFASGVGQLGAVWQGVMVYDPRLDSTVAGGSGSHRIDDETTWEYSDNPALHALTYAYGRWEDDAKLFGIGLPVDGIDVAAFMAWANVCDDNGWTLGGVIFEPGDRWDNLKNIMAAGSAEPVFSGGVLSVRYDAPRVALATVGNDDLADGNIRTRSMLSWRDRLNTVIPKYRSEAHKWEYVAADAVDDAGYLAEDGEEKAQEVQFNLVQDVDQATQLAAYRLVNGRERTVTLSLKPEWRAYGPGDMLTIDVPEAKLSAIDAVIISRRIDPATFAVEVTLLTETDGKHTLALGVTGTAPPEPDLPDIEDRDEASTVNASPNGYDQSLIANSYVSGVAGSPLSASDAGATASIAVAAHSRVYGDKTVSVSSGSITSLAFSETYLVYYDDNARAGGSVAFHATTSAADAYNSETNPDRHFVGYITTPADGGSSTGGGGSGPPGSGGGGNEVLP